jgi:hypothetical protein
MSQSVPRQHFPTEAARGDAPSTPHADRPPAEFPQHVVAPRAHSPIEREIERSERASAALAAARALARASFTDSELAADDEAQSAGGDDNRPDWVRTEYAGLDQSVRVPQEPVPHGGAPRNLVGGSFNPGIEGPAARSYAAAPMAHSPIETRAGAHARFLHESRQAPRGERPGAPVPSRLDLSAGGAGHYDKPAVVPMLAAPVAAPVARAPAGAVPGARGGPRRSSGGTVKFAVGAGVGVLAVLLAGGAAWQAGWLSRSALSTPAIVTAQVAAQAEAARLLAAPPQEIGVEPAAGTPVHRTEAEVDAALAAAARAAAVPMASVEAAGPARAIPPAPTPVAATSLAALPAHGPSAAARTVQQSKEGVAAAIAKAQARADNFLSVGAPAPATETAASPAESRPAP